MTNHEPDWQSLDEINFAIHRRMVEHLNAALAAISLVTAETEAKSPEFWQQRALNEVLTALNTYNAWASLIRYKQGEHFLTQHIRSFKASDMLNWIAAQLQLGVISLPGEEVLLNGNRETLQEALLLLHSSAYMLGPGVRLVVQIEPKGMWFRIRYSALRAQPVSFDALVEQLSGHWRARNAAFELLRARDFLAMNGCELLYVCLQDHCEFKFFIPTVPRPAPRETAPGTAVRSALLGGLEERLRTWVNKPTAGTGGTTARLPKAQVDRQAAKETTLPTLLRLLKKSLPTTN